MGALFDKLVRCVDALPPLGVVALDGHVWVQHSFHGRVLKLRVHVGLTRWFTFRVCALVLGRFRVGEGHGVLPHANNSPGLHERQRVLSYHAHITQLLLNFLQLLQQHLQAEQRPLQIVGRRCIVWLFVVGWGYKRF